MRDIGLCSSCVELGSWILFLPTFVAILPTYVPAVSIPIISAYFVHNCFYLRTYFACCYYFHLLPYSGCIIVVYLLRVCHFVGWWSTRVLGVPLSGGRTLSCCWVRHCGTNGLTPVLEVALGRFAYLWVGCSFCICSFSCICCEPLTDWCLGRYVRLSSTFPIALWYTDQWWPMMFPSVYWPMGTSRLPKPHLSCSFVVNVPRVLCPCRTGASVLHEVYFL